MMDKPIVFQFNTYGFLAELAAVTGFFPLAVVVGGFFGAALVGAATTADFSVRTISPQQKHALSQHST